MIKIKWNPKISRNLYYEKWMMNLRSLRKLNSHNLKLYILSSHGKRSGMTTMKVLIFEMN